MKQALLVFSSTCPSRKFHFTKLREKGIDIILLSEKQPPSWLSELVHAHILVSAKEPDQAMQTIAASLDSSGHTPGGVITLSETGVYFCALLSQEMGLRFVNPERVPFARNKHLMRELFRENDVPTIDFAKVSTLAEAKREAQRIGYPIVVKPLIAGAKVFIRTVDDEAGLDAFFDEYASGGAEQISNDPLYEETYRGADQPSMLIEKRIGGKTLFETELDLPVGEISVEVCSYQGQVHILGVHDKPLPGNGPFFEEVLWSAPTRLPGDYMEKVTKAARNAVHSLGIDNCIFHVEFRTLEDGPVALEMASRMGGGPVYRSLLEATGIDMLNIMVSMALGRPLDAKDFCPSKNTPVMTFGFFAEEGHLSAIEGLEDIAAMPGVLEVVVYDQLGDFIPRAPRSTHCTVHVMITGENFQQVERRGKEAERKLRFVTN